jgi:threonine/homoserine/homoserine lactone efflux protein
MGKAIGDILPLALAVAISPIPIIAIVLTLGTPRARSNGIAFAVGWLAGLTIVGTLMLVVSSGNSTQSSGAPATWTSVLKLVFGALFLALAVRAWLGRPKPGEDAEMPKWMRAIDTFAPARCSGSARCSRG